MAEQGESPSLGKHRDKKISAVAVGEGSAGVGLVRSSTPGWKSLRWSQQ